MRPELRVDLGRVPPGRRGLPDHPAPRAARRRVERAGAVPDAATKRRRLVPRVAITLHLLPFDAA
eukprot:4570285-Prymnesium_polylepis.1